MKNLPKPVEHLVQTQASIPALEKRRFKPTTDLTLEHRSNKSSCIETPFPIWQITMPLCIVLIFAIGSLTASSMVEGRYLFDLVVSREHIRIKTDVDKRELDPAGVEETMDSNETIESQAVLDRSDEVKPSK